MRLRAKITHILRYLSVSDQGMTEEERRFSHDREHRKIEELGYRFVMVASIIFPLTTVFLWNLSPEPQKIPQTWTHGLISIMFIFFRLFYKQLKLYVRFMVLLMQISLFGSYAWILHYTFKTHPDVSNVAFLSTIHTAIMIFNIVLFPFRNGSVFILGLAQVALAVWAWSSSPGLESGHWGVMTGTCTAVALTMYYARIYRSRAEALGELATRKLLLQADRRRIQLVERDMALASEIQDSFAPLESMITESGMRISFFQLKHDLLGGDWCAARRLASGDLALLVADATGKGIQAALVIHSIQTLWANALSVEAFDPETWLIAANRTLLALGQRKEHTMSIGLVILNSKKIRYFSAGHVPLMLMMKDADESKLLPIPARGPILGMSESFLLEPKEVSLEGITFEFLLLGTDGVFNRGSRFHKQEMLKLIHRLKSHGAAALHDCPALDDKLLIWVENAA